VHAGELRQEVDEVRRGSEAHLAEHAEKSDQHKRPLPWAAHGRNAGRGRWSLKLLAPATTHCCRTLTRVCSG